MTRRPCTNTEPTRLADALRELTDISDTYTQYGPEAAEIMWQQHQLIERLERDNDSLRAEVEALKKALGDAIEWNWLDDDRPEHLFRMYKAMAALRGEGEK